MPPQTALSSRFLEILVTAFGLLLAAICLAADHIGLGQPGTGLGLVEKTGIAAGLGVALAGRFLVPKIKAETRVLASWYLAAGFLLAVGTYAVLEIVFTVTETFVLKVPADYEYIYGPFQGVVRFDPKTGYRISREPGDYIRREKGKVEYRGRFFGNNYGFPDTRDFSPKRQPGEGKRIVVFGDSFTMESFHPISWPNRLEEELRKDGHSVTLLNFSLNGIGLSNWHSILRRVIEAEGFEVDAVLFAVFPFDLDRPFTVADSTSEDCYRFGWTTLWDPASFPKTLEEAKPWMNSYAHMLPSDRFERVAAGTEAFPRSFRFSLASRFRQLFPIVRTKVFRQIGQNGAAPPGYTLALGEEQMKVIDDIRAYLVSKKIPAAVINIPHREALLGVDPDPNGLSKGFAERLQVPYFDYAAQLAGRPIGEIRARFFPYDGHLSEMGSHELQAFARPVVLQLAGAKP